MKTKTILIFISSIRCPQISNNLKLQALFLIKRQNIKEISLFYFKKKGLSDTWGAQNSAQTPIEREIGSHVLQVISFILLKKTIYREIEYVYLYKKQINSSKLIFFLSRSMYD